ncbi:two-component system response regulator EvgA [Pseudomonas nitritireducens]|uniref:Two-component system response regulator EvgA n=1 Tax=Pseudomonas nitroreducens TaxID=46680 RepID=A0A7W7KKE8_PSENT|nr:response regulator transcription factor [Pseudomonas nitritireducens]MBB4864075.1 two-component system response regulator EvgA [Pseudomonas nitritireducens]
MSKRALIVDDHPLICQAIRQALESLGHEVAGECADGVEALRLIESLRPEIVVLDIGLEKMDGLSVLKRITRERLDTRVLVYTAQLKDSYAMRCLQAGAAGFVSKSEPAGQLLKAIETIVDGYVFFPRDAIPFHSNTAASAEGDLSELTDRELEILKLLAEGQSNREIADKLHLSSKTVSGHKINIQTKLAVSSVVDLANIARQNKLI